MATDPERARLDEMAARIRQAEAKAAEPAAEVSRAGNNLIGAGRIGFDFVAAVAGCAAVGWFADREFGTAPWLLLSLTLVGFVGGIANIWRSLGGYGQAVGWHKQKPKDENGKPER